MRLIDADVLLEQMKRRRGYVGRASDAVCLVEDAPTVEAEPVRRGKWGEMPSYLPMTQTETANFPFFKCSQCGWMRRRVNEYKYCPNCGARMESEVDE